MAKIYCKSSYLLRKDTAENWGNKNPVLRKGEQGLETDTGIMKIGDGVTAFNSLSDDNVYFPKSRINKSVDDVKIYANNNFTNALKSTKSDTAMLLDDVSPVTHEMSVKISSDTVTDLTAVKVSRCGKNLFNPQLLLAGTGWSVDENGVYSGLLHPLYTLYKDGFPIFFKTGLTYTVSFYAKADLTADNERSLYIKFAYTDGTTDGLMIDSTEYKLYKMTSTKDIAYMCVTYNQERTTYIKDFMLEIGTTATEYESYKGTEYTPTADGTVNGVTSLYPNTILMTDTEGAIIEAEYNRDINKAFAELQQAILSMGGNV